MYVKKSTNEEFEYILDDIIEVDLIPLNLCLI